MLPWKLEAQESRVSVSFQNPPLISACNQIRSINRSEAITQFPYRVLNNLFRRTKLLGNLRVHPASCNHLDHFLPVLGNVFSAAKN